ncbi:hypothetical protein [Dysgonomonas termitidis]|uniref:Uncharacterized protein n=1 Tax=Dysgonomonas termitidis TaxID=1516126 RepID=A0ABV9L3U2_9BACT
MILDDILVKDKKKGVNTFLPVDEQELAVNSKQLAVNSHQLTEGFDNLQATTGQNGDNLPATGQQYEGVTAARQSNLLANGSNPAAGTATRQAVKYPNKPQGLNDGEYEHLLKYFTPEALIRFTAPFDPDAGENILQRYYESAIPKPVAPDEKKVRNAQLIASIADGIGLLSQMYSYGKGAHVEKRDYSQSALSQATGRAKELENRYMQQSARYNDGLFNARLKDFQRMLDDYNTGKKGIQGVLAAKQKLDQAQAQFEDKQRLAYDKLAQEQANKDKDRKVREDNQKSLDSYRKAMVAQGWSRVGDAKNRTSAYVKKVSSSGGGKNTGYRMVIEANPADREAVRDNQLGADVRVFEMSKGEIDRYTREALSDPAFKARYPQYDRKPGLPGEAPRSFTEKERTDIAAAYLQEQYNNSFASTPAAPDYSVPSTGGSNTYRQWEQNNRLPGFGNNVPPATQPVAPSSLPVQAEEAEEAGIPEEEEEDEEFPSVGNIANF